MQNVTVIIDGVEKELVPVPYYECGDFITSNGQSYSIVNIKPHLCLDYNGNKIFKGDKIFVVNRVNFNKCVAMIGSIETAYNQLFTTEEAADEFILKNSNPPLGRDYNGNKIFKGDSVFTVCKSSFTKRVIMDIMYVSNTLYYLYHFFTNEAAADNFIKDNKPFMIITHDGFEVKEGDNIVWVTKKIFAKGFAKLGNIVDTDNCVIFSYEAAADYYIKANKPFTLTTHDGVEVKEGDNVVIVNVEMRKVQSIVRKQLIEISLAIFSTDTAADNYIRENKACLSLAMIMDELKGKGYTREGWPLNRLSELVDSIIKSEGK